MFVLCPHCQFLVGLDPRTGAPPATCPKCGGALDATGTGAPAAAAEAPAPALDAAVGAATPEPVDAPAQRPSPAPGPAPAPAPHPAPETTPPPEAAATGPSADDLVAAMAARPSRGTRKRAASDPPRRAATDTGRRRAKAPAPAPVPSPAGGDAPTAPAGDHGPGAAAEGTASGGWWQRWRRRLARPAAAPAAGPAPATVASAEAPAEAPPGTAASPNPSAAAPAAAGAAPHDSGTTTPQAAATAAPAARGWRGWRMRRNASQPEPVRVPAAEPVPATPAPGVASTSTSTATLPGTADAEGAPATTPASASAVAPAPAAATPVEAAPLPSMASPVDAGTDARTVPPTAGPDPAHADAAPHADREVSRNVGEAPSAVATPADPAPAAAAEAAPVVERRRPPEVIARDGAPPGHPLRRRTDAAPSFARAQAPPAQGGRRWIPPAIAAGLAVLLGLQLLLAQRATLAADARWRPVVAGLCRVLACTLPPWREPAAFTMLSRDVRAHPQVPGALLVDASFRNDARWPQPWPRVVLTLSNVEGRVVGARAFQARDYLGDESATTQTTLAPGQTAAIRLAIIEPAPDVVAFSFDFR